jgi:hypothetical protein
MTTRRADILIRKVRQETGNEDFGPNSGISDAQICDALNDGLTFLEEGINQTNAHEFLAEDFIDLVAGQEKYALPSDYLPGGGVWLVEYKYAESASSPQYFKLKKVTTLERGPGIFSSTPESYVVIGRELWIRPIPYSSKTDGLRILYAKRLTRLATREGTVSAVTLNGGTNTITSLVLDIDTVNNFDEFPDNEYCSIVDADGNIKMANIKLDGDDLLAGVVPVRSDFTYTTGETIAVGDYLVFGKNTSTHNLVLDEAVDRFLKAYGAWKVMRVDSNDDQSAQMGELSSMRDSIIASFAKQNEDVTLIPEFGDC